MAADMVSLAVKLSESGLGDYWDDVDRWVRNNFAEQQLTSSEWVYRSTEDLPKQPLPPHSVAEHTPERNIGAFAGWSSGNDWVVNGGIMHCCTGNGTRAIYYVWQSILQSDNERLKVNLLLNRAAPGADIYSYLPYSGRVDLKIKTSFRSVLVRAPEWIESGSNSVVCTVNGISRPVHWQGRSVEIGPAEPGQTLILTFPVSKRTVTERIGPDKYTLVLQGNTVVSIDPSGKHGPLYNDRLLSANNEMRWLKLDRFISGEPIAW